jgi:glycosyltransferase involved in cell wall biosynthesis
MSTPIVSAIIATYNAGHYLEEAIRSILAQTMPDLELLVIDDGSTDGTRALVAGFTDPRVRYVWQENAGQTSAKNHGLRLARGNFIGFCDGDDFWYPNKLDLQLACFQKNPRLGVVYSPADKIDEQGRPLGAAIAEEFRGKVTDALFLRNFVPFGTALVRRACVERTGGFDPALKMGIDWDLWLRVSVDFEFEYLTTSTYAYRIWTGQMSHNWRGRYSSAFAIMEKFLREHPRLISRRLRRRAFANTYSNRGRMRMREQRWPAVADALRGAWLDPLAGYSWKTLTRTTLHAMRLSG